MEPLAVYVHTPFCPSKCGYCDFNSYAMEGEIIGRTVEAIRTEIERSPHVGRPAKTIFFGGGTPTFLDSKQLISLLETVMSVHPPIKGCEITSEANPGTVDAEKFGAMRGAGFNRVSLGAQSFLDSDLLTLERVHKASEIGRAIQSARKAGFENLNIDLMFALPGQSKFAWIDNLKKAFELGTDHLSLYCLTIEENTKFYKLFLKGLLDLPDDNSQSEMYDLAVDTAAQYGFLQYEISNFAKPGYECQHNLCYWRCEEYAAYGPGAVEQVGGRRWTHLKHPKLYCEAVEEKKQLECESEILDASMKREEAIMLGLRLNDGISVEATKANPDGITIALERGWISVSKDKLKLTSSGRHYCNQAILLLF